MHLKNTKVGDKIAVSLNGGHKYNETVKSMENDCVTLIDYREGGIVTKKPGLVDVSINEIVAIERGD